MFLPQYAKTNGKSTKTSRNLVKSEVSLSASGSAAAIAPLNCRTKPGGQVIPKAEERKGKQGPELLPAGPRLLPSMRSEPWALGLEGSGRVSGRFPQQAQCTRAVGPEGCL